MINCIVVDDNLVSINLFKHFIVSTEGLNFVEAFSNPITAMNYLRKTPENVDLIFLDIEMPEINGMEFIESFKELPPVIFITSKEKYAVKAFEHKVIHFLVKPVDYGKFLKAIERVFKLYESKNSQNLESIYIKEKGVMQKILLKEIYYLEALGDFVKVKSVNKNYVASSTMKNIEDKLATCKDFIRVHRSYIINLNYLENFDAETAVVAGNIIPIGSKYKFDLQSRLNII